MFLQRNAYDRDWAVQNGRTRGVYHTKLYLCDCLRCVGWDHKDFWNKDRSCWIYIRLTGIQPFIQQLNEIHKGPRVCVLSVNSKQYDTFISWSLRPDCAPPRPLPSFAWNRSVPSTVQQLFPYFPSSHRTTGSPITN